MSCRVFFSLSTGVSKSIRVPKGTCAEIRERIADVEQLLGLETEQYLDNPPHWKTSDFADVSDEVLCEAAEKHNRFVRWLYSRLVEWQDKCPRPGEWLTPAKARTFWHGLEMINVPPERWTNGYYHARMEAVYTAMRGEESEGQLFDVKALTTKQAAAVIVLFSQWLDKGDIRLDVANEHDDLRSSYDGGYVWCEKCGAVAEEDRGQCRKRGCPLREEEEESCERI